MTFHQQRIQFKQWNDKNGRSRGLKGGTNDLDDLCSTRDTVAIRICERLRDGRINPYFASPSSNCAGSRPLSETMTAVNDL